MTEEVLLQEELSGGVLLLTLNRPDRLNAINKALETAFVDALAQAERDDAVGAVVVAGAGDRAFSAGYDVFEMSQWPVEQFRIEQIRQSWSWWSIAQFGKPLVTANHAITMGWGAITSVSADIRIGCADTLFQFTASPHGGANLTWNLPQLVGWSKAKEYLMTSCRIDADEARSSGLLNRIVPRERVLEEAIAVATTMASYPPSGVRAIKRLFREGLGLSQEARLFAEMNASQRQFETAGQVVEASYRDFVARREPDAFPAIDR